MLAKIGGSKGEIFNFLSLFDIFFVVELAVVNSLGIFGDKIGILIIFSSEGPKVSSYLQQLVEMMRHSILLFFNSLTRFPQRLAETFKSGGYEFVIY